jgi:hypothetical protein
MMPVLRLGENASAACDHDDGGKPGAYCGLVDGRAVRSDAHFALRRPGRECVAAAEFANSIEVRPFLTIRGQVFSSRHYFEI